MVSGARKSETESGSRKRTQKTVESPPTNCAAGKPLRDIGADGLALRGQFDPPCHFPPTSDVCLLSPARSPRRAAPTVCRYPVSGTVSLPSSGCFSPFPHGTCSLSVAEEYLGLEGGPPAFRQDCTCPALLEIFRSNPIHTGLSPAAARLSSRFW